MLLGHDGEIAECTLDLKAACQETIAMIFFSSSLSL